jgi:hypothetical protein
MNVKELAQLIDTQAGILLGGLVVRVFVRDIKNVYGRTRYLVEPVAGNGAIWVENIKRL